MSESGGAERLRQVVESPRARRAAAGEEDGPLDPSRLHRLRDRLAHSCPYEHAADGGREGAQYGALTRIGLVDTRHPKCRRVQGVTDRLEGFGGNDEHFGVAQHSAILSGGSGSRTSILCRCQHSDAHRFRATISHDRVLGAGLVRARFASVAAHQAEDLARSLLGQRTGRCDHKA